jgi:crotonobetainyl-CoA:carnitine CoA-transferase CaiB-like acyl-CoA transferase
VTGESPGQVGNSHHNIVPYGCYPVKDGHIVLTLLTGNFWRNFCRAAGRPDLIEDERFQTTADRLKHREEIDRTVIDILAQKTMAEWHEIFEEGDVPHGPVNTIGDALTQPLVKTRGLLRTTDHPVAGKVDVVGSPIQFQEDVFDLPARAAPLLGEHSGSVLKDILGYSAAQIDALAESGVIECAPPVSPKDAADD